MLGQKLPGYTHNGPGWSKRAPSIRHDEPARADIRHVQRLGREKLAVARAGALERLHHERGFMIYLVVCLAAFVLLMYTSMPWLYRWFNVEPASITPLWTIGR